MIKKLAAIGLIVLSLASVGCTNERIDENKQANPGVEKNTTGGDEEQTKE